MISKKILSPALPFSLHFQDIKALSGLKRNAHLTDKNKNLKYRVFTLPVRVINIEIIPSSVSKPLVWF